MSEVDQAPGGVLDAWRAQLLTRMLRIVLVLGVVVGVPSIAFAIAVDAPLIAIVEAVALGLLVFITFRTSLSYRTRVVTLVVLSYLLGVFLLTVVGVVGQLYLVAFPVFAAVLLGLRPAVVALAINAVTLVTAGLFDVFDTEVAVGALGAPVDWLLVVLNLLFVTTVLVAVCAVLLGRLQRSLTDEQAVSTSPEQQRAHLAEINRDLERETTARRRAETAVERLAVAVAQTRDLIVISEPDGSIVSTNDAYEELVARVASLPQEARLTDLWSDPGQRREITEAFRDGRSWAGTLLFRTQAATELELDTQVAPVTSPDGEVVAFVAVFRDVTNERRMAARLRRAEKLEALGTLASGAAHDVNNVLATVLAAAEMTGVRTEDEEVRRSMELIVSACERARDVAGQMTVFGRRSDLGARRTPVGELLEGTLPLLRAALPANVRIDTDLGDDGIILARPADLDQVVTNLASNAAHAMGDDPNATLSISTRCVDRDDPALHTHPTLESGRSYVQITISDTGAGIDPDHLDDIFDPSFTTKDPSEGNGLGLASVHAIVTSFGGDIEVESQPGVGTTFRIRLPTVDDEAGPTPPPEAPSAEGAGGPATVLFVDDEQALRTMSAQALRKYGYEVVTAADGSEALTAFERDPSLIDVVVTDLTMPEMNGAELIRRVRLHRPELPVVLCSGYGEAARREGISAAEVSVYLGKPFTVEELVARIRQAMQGASSTPK